MSHKTLHPIQPITPAELIEFRELLFPDGASDTSRRRELSASLDLDPSNVWHREKEASTRLGVLIRRALVNVADEMEVKLPERLRFGTSAKSKVKRKAAGAR